MERDLYEPMNRATPLEQAFKPCPIRAQRDRLASGRTTMA
jgi:hypothetical protein